MTKLKLTNSLHVPKSHHPHLTEDVTVPAPNAFIENARYCSDGVAVAHNVDFIDEPEFVKQAEFSLAYHIEKPNFPYGMPSWRVYIAGWAAQQALRLDGDFVECGVDTGILSSIVCQRTDFNTHKRDFYLLDSFEGMELDQLTPDEIQQNAQSNLYNIYKQGYQNNSATTFEILKSKIDQFQNIHIIKGYIPETLEHIKTDTIAYLSIDLNAVFPEMATIKFLWDRLTVGAVILLDDYTFSGHAPQKNAWNSFAQDYHQSILPLWTGQGLIIKTPYQKDNANV